MIDVLIVENSEIVVVCVLVSSCVRFVLSEKSEIEVVVWTPVMVMGDLGLVHRDWWYQAPVPDCATPLTIALRCHFYFFIDVDRLGGSRPFG